MTFLPTHMPAHGGAAIQAQEVARFEQLEPRVLFSAVTAFPGAEGFGAYSLGGRGDGSQVPQILTVDTLEDVVADDGMMSLREAVQADGPRFIVFSVGGIIELDETLVIKNPYLTIAGQTAPSPGITLANYGISVQDGAHDIVIRYMRIRPVIVDEYTHVIDGIQLYGRDEANFVDNVIIDHCSMAWALDENFSAWGWVGNFTVQYSTIIGGAQYGHAKGPHSMGILTGGTGSQGNINGTFHHNLIAHNNDRNPLLAGGNMFDFRNNIIYNWAGRYSGSLYNNFSDPDAQDDMQVNIVNNFYIGGNDVVVEPSRTTFLSLPLPESNDTPQIYFSGNIGPVGAVENEWDAYVEHHGQPELYRLDEPVATAPVETDSVLDALNDVLDNAGVNYVTRDSVDEGIITEIRYILETYSDDSLNIQALYNASETDTNLGVVGPNHGELTTVLWFKPDITLPDYSSYIPRQCRIQEGQTVEEAKEALLDIMVAEDRITEAHKQEILNDTSGTYEWEVVDKIIPNLNTVLATTPAIYDSPSADSDSDGMPDYWEEEHGLDKYDATDSVLDSDSDGYLNIEEFINATEPVTAPGSGGASALEPASMTGGAYSGYTNTANEQSDANMSVGTDFLAVENITISSVVGFDSWLPVALYTVAVDDANQPVGDALTSIEGEPGEESDHAFLPEGHNSIDNEMVLANVSSQGASEPDVAFQDTYSPGNGPVPADSEYFEFGNMNEPLNEIGILAQNQQFGPEIFGQDILEESHTINGMSTTSSDTSEIMAMGSEIGQFGAVTGTEPGNGFHFNLDDEDRSLVITVMANTAVLTMLTAGIGKLDFINRRLLAVA